MKKKITAILLSIVMFFSVFATFGASVFAEEAAGPVQIKITGGLTSKYDGSEKKVQVTTNDEGKELDHYTIYATLNAALKPVVSIVFQDTLLADKNLQPTIEGVPGLAKFVKEIIADPQKLVLLVTGEYPKEKWTGLNTFAASVKNFITVDEDNVTFKFCEFLSAATQAGFTVDELNSISGFFAGKFGSEILTGLLDALKPVIEKIDGTDAKVTIGNAPTEAGLYLVTVVATLPTEGKGFDIKIMTIKPKEAFIRFDEKENENKLYDKAADGTFVEIKDAVVGEIYTGRNDKGVSYPEYDRTQMVWIGALDVNPEDLEIPGVYQEMAYYVGGGNYYAKPVFRTIIVADGLSTKYPDPEEVRKSGGYIIEGYDYVDDVDTGHIAHKDASFDKKTYEKAVDNYTKQEAENKQKIEFTFVRTVRNTIANILGKIFFPVKKAK